MDVYYKVFYYVIMGIVVAFYAGVFVAIPLDKYRWGRAKRSGCTCQRSMFLYWPDPDCPYHNKKKVVEDGS